MTIKDNMLLIRQYSGRVFTSEFVEDLLNSLDDLLPALARMDNKDKSDITPASKEDVVGLLRNIDQNTDLQDAIIDGFNVAGPVMILTMQVLAIQTLMRNPEEFAQKLTVVPQCQAFKDNPTARGMGNYILDSVTKKRRPIPRSISVWDEAENEDDGVERTRSRRRHAEASTRGKQSATSSNQRHQQRDTWGSSPTRTGRQKKQADSNPTARSRKRTRPVPSDTESEGKSGSNRYSTSERSPTKRWRQISSSARTSPPRKSISSGSSDGTSSSEEQKLATARQNYQQKAASKTVKGTDSTIKKSSSKDIGKEATLPPKEAKGKAAAKQKERLTAPQLGKKSQKTKNSKEKENAQAQQDNVRILQEGKSLAETDKGEEKSHKKSKKKSSKTDKAKEKNNEDPLAEMPSYPTKRKK